MKTLSTKYERYLIISKSWYLAIFSNFKMLFGDHVHVHMYACMHICTHVQIHARACIHACTCTHACTQVHMHTHMYTCTRICSHTHTSKHVCIRVFHNNTFSSNDLRVLAIGDHYGENYPDFFSEFFDLIFIAVQPKIENGWKVGGVYP